MKAVGFCLVSMIISVSWAAMPYLPSRSAILPENCLIIQSDTNTVMERRISDILFHIPEVRMSSRFIDSITQHRHGISIRTIQRPGKVTNYYEFDLGYDGELRFQNYYLFRVWPKKMTIGVMDVFTNQFVTLAEWRRRRKEY